MTDQVEPEFFIAAIKWLNPKFNRPMTDGDYILLARGEKQRTYCIMATWNGSCFVDDMGLQYLSIDYIAYADMNMVQRPPFQDERPKGYSMRRRYFKRRHHDM